jgi:hypothetical protein
MRSCQRFLAGIPHFLADNPRVTHPSATPCLRRAFDLHVLGTPPAFILSQDQTRHPMMYLTHTRLVREKCSGDAIQAKYCCLACSQMFFL